MKELFSVTTKDILASQFRRADELREAESVRVNESILAMRTHVCEMMQVRSDFDKAQRIAETKRIDAILSMNAENVALAAERASEQAQVLANQLATSAETVRVLVDKTAITLATQLTQITNQITERLSALERTQYEKQGQGVGIQQLWGYIFAAGALLVSAGSSIFMVLHYAR